MRRTIRLLTLLLQLALLWPESDTPLTAGTLSISHVVDNSTDYVGETVPRYKKIEVTFQLENTKAKNFQLPYDSNPPPGIAPEIGITVEALFTPDGWQTIYRQPAFYYQQFIYKIRNQQEWMYPTDNYSWKVRFAPNQIGKWHYRLEARDISGTTKSPDYSFEVSSSANPGFIRVSTRDSRYFEFEDGTYFPSLGYNYHPFNLRNPWLEQRDHLQIMAENGIQLIRVWLPPQSIYGAEWSPWNSPNPAQNSGYLPLFPITFEESYPGSDVSMKISNESSPCMFIGAWKAKPAVKKNTSYRIRVRYKTAGIEGPKTPGAPFGLVAKTGGWLWSENEAQRCYAPGTGTWVTPHQDQDTEDWEILEGSLNSGDRYFLPNFYLALENVNNGVAYIDFVSIQDELGGGSYGPNIVSKPWMAQHLYFEQRNSFAFDKFIELCEEHDIYLKATVLEKNDRILNRIDAEGKAGPKSPGNENFYGKQRSMTKVRWLQQAWWRYLQARWGYSTSIHSWELLNEGDPFSGLHHVLADEFGKYMHQFKPNHHLVSTSTWHSFPLGLWASDQYPDIDYADVHSYVSRGQETKLRVGREQFIISSPEDYFDAAAVTQKLGQLTAAQEIQKPVVRGETGFVTGYSGPPDPELGKDRQGIWLHNFLWGGLNPGGLIELYWYDTAHIYPRKRDGSYFFDHRPVFGSFSRFVKNLPLNNGHYVDAEARVSHPEIRAWGQKDLKNLHAHLWIQNKQHTWKNTINSGSSVTSVSGTVSVSGFPNGLTVRVEWWDTYAGVPAHSQTFSIDDNGVLTLPIDQLLSDIAVKIHCLE